MPHQFSNYQLRFGEVRMGFENPIRVFISYATEDSDKASQLSESLSWLGFDTFLAHDDIGKGEEWRTSIDNNLSSSDVFLPLLTDAALSSAWVNQESGIAHFLKNKKKKKFTIIPLVQGRKIPPGCLSIYQAQSLKVGLLGMGRVIITNELVRKLALEIVKNLNCFELASCVALVPLKSAEAEKTEHIILFLHGLNSLEFNDFLELIDHEEKTEYVSSSDDAMNCMFQWLKLFDLELNKHPKWVAAWNRMVDRYEKRKEEERRLAQERAEATTAYLKYQVDQMNEERKKQRENSASDKNISEDGGGVDR